MLENETAVLHITMQNAVGYSKLQSAIKRQNILIFITGNLTTVLLLIIIV